MKREYQIMLCLVLWMWGGWGQMGLSACTMLLVGKDASADGSVLLAHNNDLPGDVASMIQVVPGGRHSSGEMIEFKNGLRIPQVERTFRMLMMNCYYGFAEGDAKAVNQFQVAVAGGTSMVKDRNEKAERLDPLVTGGVTGYIRYIALSRSRSARECVEMIGAMYTKYGIAYPSAVGVADPREVWYIEAGGGRCWVARRVPDNTYLAVANGYRIGEIDFNDRDNFIFPPYLKSYAREKGLWNPGKNNQNPFHFARIFGGKYEGANDYYNARRVWRMQQMLSGRSKPDSRAFTHPFALEPDQKITLRHLISVLRDYYRGTPFDVSRVPEGEPRERVVATFATDHTSVIQLRDWLPVEIGAVLWGGVGSALSTPYVPYYFGIKEIPRPYRTAGPGAEGPSAYRVFRGLHRLLESRLGQLADRVVPTWENLESGWFAARERVEREVLAFYRQDRQKAVDFLDLYTNSLALMALEHATALKSRFEN